MREGVVICLCEVVLVFLLCGNQVFVLLCLSRVRVRLVFCSEVVCSGGFGQCPCVFVLGFVLWFCLLSRLVVCQCCMCSCYYRRLFASSVLDFCAVG